MGKCLTTEQFVERANKVHNSKYDYSLVDYKNGLTKVEIICPEHGGFWQAPKKHLQKQGCGQCGRKRTYQSHQYNNKIFIEKANKVYNNKYDYSKILYENSDKPVEIICPEHGSFWQIPKVHLTGHNCPDCAIENRIKKRSFTTKQFIEKARKIHGNKYDYSLVEYINANTYLDIICPEHGKFKQRGVNHLCGYGCLKCSGKEKKTLEEFILSAKQIHVKKYDYGLSNYKNNKTKIKILCKKCGNIFECRPDNHLFNKCGCPTCCISKAQEEINDYVISLGFKTEQNNRKLISPLELDIYIPEKRIAIEYNGLFWHSEQQLAKRTNKPKYYHFEKTRMCEENNVRLIHIFEDEWINKKQIVKNRLRMILGKCSDRIGARQTTIKEIDAKIKNIFLNNTHIQGGDRANAKLGAFYNNELVGVMTFCLPRVALGNRRRGRIYELSRFATLPNTLTPGLASKMFSFFVKKYNPEVIYTYSDKRWNTGNLYKKIGMNFCYATAPNYFYIVEENRVHRFNFRKQRLPDLLESFNSELTEYENMLLNDYDRVWDCGNDKYELTF